MRRRWPLCTLTGRREKHERKRTFIRSLRIKRLTALSVCSKAAHLQHDSHVSQNIIGNEPVTVCVSEPWLGDMNRDNPILDMLLLVASFLRRDVSLSSWFLQGICILHAGLAGLLAHLHEWGTHGQLLLIIVICRSQQTVSPSTSHPRARLSWAPCRRRSCCSALSKVLQVKCLTVFFFFRETVLQSGKSIYLECIYLICSFVLFFMCER